MSQKWRRKKNRSIYIITWGKYNWYQELMY